MAQRLALFDLDNTLLAGDSDHAWGEFMITRGLVDEATHRVLNDEYYQHYLSGELDIHDYVRFTLSPVLDYSRAELDELHRDFMARFIRPMISREARELVAQHKRNRDCCVIITATNSFITAPIAEEFAVENLLATELEIVDERFTGNIAGTPCYKSGKVDRLKDWLQSQEGNFTIEDSVFYSDSINDLALLDLVAEPVAVDPDQQLQAIAAERDWTTLHLHGQTP